MIHRYAAWFCQGGLVRTFLRGLWLVGPWVTQSCWESWDVRRDSEESCTCSAMMLWGYRDIIWIDGWWLLQPYEDAHIWVKCFAVTWGKCVAVIVANVHVQHFSHLSASRRISADLYTSDSSSLCLPNRQKDLLSAVWCHRLLTDGKTAFMGHLQQNKEQHFVAKPVDER